MSRASKDVIRVQQTAACRPRDIPPPRGNVGKIVGTRAWSFLLLPAFFISHFLVPTGDKIRREQPEMAWIGMDQDRRTLDFLRLFVRRRPDLSAYILTWVPHVHSAGKRGFRVGTRAALVADIGTEFGVIAYPDGSTEAYVPRGRTRVGPDPNRSGRPTSRWRDHT